MRLDFFETILVILIVLVVGLLGYLVITEVDQHMTTPVYVGTTYVETMDHGTRTTFIMAGKVFVPITTPFWEITYTIDNYRVTSGISETCYQTMGVGREIQVYVRRGIFSTRYYPAC